MIQEFLHDIVDMAMKLNLVNFFGGEAIGL